MSQTAGNFMKLDENQAYLMLRFPFTSMPVQARWRNNGLSADFLADYWETFSCSNEILSPCVCNEAKDAIRYIANELLENAVKFDYTPSKKPITVEFYISDQELRFHITNSIDPQKIEPFRQYIQQLLSLEDLDTLYLQQLERNAAIDSTESRLGLLTVLHNYRAELAWEFETDRESPEIIMLTTMARLDFDTFSNQN
jgi:hypothetical protein